MKHKICISVDEDTLIKVHAAIRSKDFRNRSHVFEKAVASMLEERE